MIDTNLSDVTIDKVRGCLCNVLPLTLYECISTPEVLSKLTNKLNEVIDVTNALPAYIEQLIVEYLTGGKLGDLFGEILRKYFLTVKNPPNGITPAVGDGSVDDTAAFQGCIDYASTNGLTVIVPSGKYLVQPLTVKSNMTLLGMGKHSTYVVLKGGATAELIGGSVENFGMAELTLDANMDIQVNNVDCMSISAGNSSIRDVIFIDGYDCLALEKTGDVELSNLEFTYAVEHFIHVGGMNGTITANGLKFGQLSTLRGISGIITDASGDVYKNIISKNTIPVGIEVDGNNNVFNGLIQNAVNAINDTGTGNNYDLYMLELKESFSGSSSTKANSIYQTATDEIEINATKTISQTALDIIINPTNPLTYKTPAKLDDYFNYIEFKDSTGTPYKVLVYNGEELQTGLFVDVKKYGAKGDGITDDTLAIQNCINENQFVFFSDGTYLIQSDDGLMVPDNKFILGSNNSLLQKGATSAVRYSVLTVQGNNVAIQNVNINGDRSTHTGTEGEWGHCFELDPCDRVSIINCSGTNGWGDGFYIGGHGVVTNSVLYNCKSDNNRRNGFSIIQAKHLLLQSCEGSNTNGTNPQFAIDIEPNLLTTPTPIVVEINNFYSHNNARGAISADASFVKPTDEFNVIVNSLRSEYDGKEGLSSIGAVVYIDNGDNQTIGQVEFNDCSIMEAKCPAFGCHQKNPGVKPKYSGIVIKHDYQTVFSYTNYGNNSGFEGKYQVIYPHSNVTANLVMTGSGIAADSLLDVNYIITVLPNTVPDGNIVRIPGFIKSKSVVARISEAGAIEYTNLPELKVSMASNVYTVVFPASDKGLWCGVFPITSVTPLIPSINYSGSTCTIRFYGADGTTLTPSQFQLFAYLAGNDAPDYIASFNQA